MFILAYDNLDEKLGGYFSECATEIKAILKSPIKEHIIEIFGEQLNMVHIDLQLTKINRSGFIFCAFSHGTVKSLNARNVAFIESGINTGNLVKGLIYTNACLAGDKLAKEIITKGAEAFIGYKGEVHGILDEDYRKISIRCDNYALILFLDNYSIEEAVKKAKEYFTLQIDKIGFSSPFISAILRENRDSLVSYGNMDLKLKDLIQVIL